MWLPYYHHHYHYHCCYYHYHCFHYHHCCYYCRFRCQQLASGGRRNHAGDDRQWLVWSNMVEEELLPPTAGSDGWR